MKLPAFRIDYKVITWMNRQGRKTCKIYYKEVLISMKNKFLKGVVSFSVASAICMAMGITASAAVKESDITIDPETQTLTVKEELTSTTVDSVTTTNEDELDREILFAVPSVNSSKKAKIASWDIYPTQELTEQISETETKKYKAVTIDLSSLNTQKDNYILIKGDRGDANPIAYKIPATDKKVKPKYNGTNAVAAEGSTAALEYRTQYGDWQDYVAPAEGVTGTDLSLYQQRGATLYFRLKSKEPAADAQADTLTDSKDSTQTYTAKVANTLPGKEVKVKIGKMANAPKATINYVKNTVKLPKNAKYVAFDAEAALPDASAWKTGDGEISDATVMNTILGGGILEVRTTKSGKPDSKIAHYDFSVQEELSGTVEDTDTEASVTKVNDSTNRVVNTDADDTKGVKANLVDGKKDKTGKVTRYDLEFSNDSGDKYEVIKNAAKPEATAKGKAIKANTSKPVKITDVKDGDFVWIRKVGDQKKGTWTTNWEKMGKVVVPASSTDDPGNTTPVQSDVDLLASEYVLSTVTLSNNAENTAISLDKDATHKLTIGSEAEYTLSNGKKISATITITVNDACSGVLATDASAGLKYGAAGTATTTLAASNKPSVTVTVTPKADSGLTAKTVNITFTL